MTDDHVVTVDRALARPVPATRTHTFASRFDTSTPAHRGCTTSIIVSSRSALDVRSGEGRKFESLMLVLDGSIPRFPWEPSTTMLTYRLQGTTEATASNRNRHPSLHPRRPTRSGTRGRGDHIFARPGEHPEVLCDADLHLLPPEHPQTHD